MDRWSELLGTGLPAEDFVRRALGVLEADFRELALGALGDWERLEIVSSELFTAIAALQRPSWGSWNGLLSAIRNARKKVLRSGAAGERERVESAEVLSRTFSLLDEAVDPEWASALRPLVELTRIPIGKKLLLGEVLTIPIGLRNRIAHDQPTDRTWWQSAAAALTPLIVFHSRRDMTVGKGHPPPWFLEEGQDIWAFNGLAPDDAAIYVSSEGKTKYVPERTVPMLRSLQRLLGKAEVQEKDFRKLLSTLAPEEVKGVLMGDLLVGKPVGSGGFATVHVGRQLSTGRKLAVKILHDGLPEDAKLRFRQEATYLSRFNHPHIVGVIAYGEDPWSAPRAFSLSAEPWYQAFSKTAPVKTYIALEWVEGRTLEEVFKEEERRDTKQLAAWMGQAASALAAVHGAGLIHRDVKPSNLMVADDGLVRLMDFGIARSQGETRTLVTATGSAVGTPAYMSPEQIRATDAEAEVGPATDVYSLAASFYELFTGTRLFRHDQEPADRVRTKKLSGERPDPPRAGASGLPWEIETILMGGLEPEIADRYSSAEALARDVEAFLEDRPIQYRKPSLARRLRLGYRRNRMLTNFIFVFVLLIAAGVGAYVHRVLADRDEARRLETLARVQALRAATGLAESHLARAFELYGREQPDALGIVGTGSRAVAAALEGGEILGLLAPSVETRNLAERLAATRRSAETLLTFVANRASSRPATAGGRMTTHGLPLCVAVSPEPGGGELLAGTDHLLVLHDRRGTPLRVFSGHTDLVQCSAFSQDGSRIVSGSLDGTVRIWSRASGAQLAVFLGHTGRVTRCAFSPDGREVVSAADDGTVRLWDPATGLGRVLDAPGAKVGWCAFSPDGVWVAASSSEGVRVWDRATAKPLRTLEPGGSEAAITPDGSELLVAKDQGIDVWDPREGTRLRRIDCPARILCVALSRTGDLLAVGSSDGKVRLIERGSGKVRMTLEGPRDLILSVAFAPDGAVFASSWDRSLRVWDARGAPEIALEDPLGMVLRCQFSSDGKTLISTGAEHVAILDASTGEILRILPAQGGRPVGTALSPGGTRLALATSEGVLAIVEMATGKTLRTFEAAAATGCAWTPDESEVVLGVERGPPIAVNVATGRRRLLGEGTEPRGRGCPVSPDGELVLDMLESGPVLRERTSGNVLHKLEGHQGAVLDAAFSPDGREILTAGEDRQLRLWSRDTAQSVRVFEGHRQIVVTCGFAGPGTIVSTSPDGELRLWDRASGRPRRIVEAGGGRVLLFSGTVSPLGAVIATSGSDLGVRFRDACDVAIRVPGVQGPVALAASGNEVLSGREGPIAVVRLPTGESVSTLAATGTEVETFALSPDGRQVLVGTMGKKLLLVDREADRLVFTLQGNEKGVSACAFTPDGEFLLSGGRDGTVRIWDRRSGQPGPVFRGHSSFVFACAASADGTQILSGSEDRTARLWDRATGRLHRSLEGHTEAVAAVRFAPFGTEALTASLDGTLKVWDRASGHELRTLRGHTGPVMTCAYSPDGRLIASGSVDGSARVWEAGTGALLLKLEGHEGPVLSCDFSPDGRRLITGSEDVRLFDLGLRFSFEATFPGFAADPPGAARRGLLNLQRFGTPGPPSPETFPGLAR